MRVLIADKLPDQTRTRLASHGFEVVAEPTLKGESLAERLSELDPDILVVRSTKVTATHTEAGPSLSLVIRAGAGTNTIDTAACSARGIFVANCPGKNAVAVAELTIGWLIALDRFLPDGVRDLRNGQWNKAAYAKARGLSGRVLGLIGLGAIGQAVATRAQALGMTVLAWSRSLTPKRAAELGVTFATTPEEVARQADAVSVHVALTPETSKLVGESIFSTMRHGALFINTSRSEVVDETALANALESNDLRAALDVFDGEPSDKTAPFDHPLAKHPRVYGSHHIGASTLQAQEAVGDEVCRISETFRDEGRVVNLVNTLTETAATHRLVVRHLDQVGVLAQVLKPLSEAAVNVQEMENIVFPGGAAIARIQVSEPPSDDLLRTLHALPAVLHVTVTPL
ncbi:MAG: 3-phosphoglycerate dehydrogenase family protein [Myxococcota bacterium]